MKRFQTLLLIPLLFLMLSYGCEEKIEQDQFGYISGVVYSDSANVPLENVAITTSPASNAVLSEENGGFFLNNVPTGEVAVKAEKNGFTIKNASVNVTANDTAQVVILLTANNNSGNGSENFDGVLSNPDPQDNANNVAVDTSLRWSYTGDENNITFDVYLYASNSGAHQKLGDNLSDTVVMLEQLDYETTYFWYVIARNSANQTMVGDVWTFTTADLPDNRLTYVKQISTNAEVYTSGLEGDNELRITNNPTNDLNPALSPVLSRISFTSDRGNDYQIFHAKKDGSDLVQATTLPVAGYHNSGVGYCWSPNAGGFLYSHYDKIYYIDKDGSGLQAIKDTAPNGKNWRELDWNGNTNKIVAQAVGVNIYESEIYLMDADGSNLQLIVTDTAGRTDHPVFSADGSKVLFTQDASGLNQSDGRQLDARIYSLDLNTMRVTDLSGGNKPAGTNDLMPEFSPNNAKIIFVNVDNTGSGQRDIYQMDVDGSDRELLIPDATMPHAK